LGDNSTRNSLRPVAVYNLDKARALTTGFQHTCVVTTRKAIKCWGSNEFGEVGDNTTIDTPQPVRVFGF
jgi:alpha-tubulin suppressor-like RCC1 family protein